jgi:hypothetical protein
MDLLAAARSTNASAITAEVDRRMAAFLASQAPKSAIVPPPLSGALPPSGPTVASTPSRGVNVGASTSGVAPQVVVVEGDDDDDDDADDDDPDDREHPAGNGTFDRGAQGVLSSDGANALNPVLLTAPSAASTKRDARPPPASFYQDRISPPEGMGQIADSQVDFASK